MSGTALDRAYLMVPGMAEQIEQSPDPPRRQ